MQSNDGNMSLGAKVTMSPVIGGTAEKLGGGKFANGAVTGAYVMMFNHLGKEMEMVRKLKKYQDAIYGMILPDGTTLTKDDIRIYFQDAFKAGFSQSDANAMYLGEIDGVYHVTFSIGDFEETPDNIRLVVVHEVYGHGMKGYGDGSGTHHKAYFAEIDSQYWSNATDRFKQHAVKWMWHYYYKEVGYQRMPTKYQSAFDQFYNN
jgi:hypothetical protein